MVNDLTLERAHRFVEEANADPAQVCASLEPILDLTADTIELPNAVACWALGLAMRNLRRLDDGEVWLRRAIDHLELGTEEHTGAGLSVAGLLAHRGDFDAAEAELNNLAPPDAIAGRVIYQRASIAEFRGDLHAARIGYEQAAGAFRKSHDRLGEAHCLSGQGLLEVHYGEASTAVATFGLARSIYEELDLPTLIAVANYNIGFAATEAGDIGTALHYLDLAHQATTALGEPFGELSLLHVYALSAAGLVTEAAARAVEALADLDVSGADNDKAEMLLALGRSLGATGQIEAARRVLDAAASMVQEQGRDLWTATARLAIAETQPAELLDMSELERLRSRFAAHGSILIVDAELALARAAAAQGTTDLLDELAGVAAARRADARDTLIRCIADSVAGRSRAVIDVVITQLESDVLTHANHGLDLKAGIAASRNDLVELGLRSARQLDDAEDFAKIALLHRRFLHSADRDDRLDEDVLVALRSTADVSTWRRIADSLRAQPAPAEQDLVIEPVDLASLAPALIVALVGEFFCAVEITTVQSQFVDLPEREWFFDAVERLRAAAARSAMGDHQAWSANRATLESVQAALPLLANPNDKQVLRIVTAGSADLIPWPLISARPVRVLADDLAVAKPKRSADGVVVAIAGPNLESSESEIAAMQQIHPSMTTLAAPDSTPTNAIQQLAGASIAHLCCHGELVTANPMMSHLVLSEGVLTGYEIERIADAPTTVVSASCWAGGMASAESGSAALGLSAAWLAAGTTTVVAPFCRVPDGPETIAAMTAIHRGLIDGQDPEVAVHNARLQGHDAIARTLVVFGRAAAKVSLP